MDDDQNAYITEVQKLNTHNLPHRSRLYHGLIDSKMLPLGVTDYNELNIVYIIIISPFDVFGYGRYKYTFEYRCIEVPALELQDGSIRMFLNTHGNSDAETDSELIELLHYMEHTNEEYPLSSNKINRLKQNVHRVQLDAEVGVRYMQAWEEIEYARQEGRQEGIQLGLQEGIQEGTFTTLVSLVKENLLSVEIAAKRSGLTTEEFLQKMKELK